MATEIVVTDEFTAWYEALSKAEQTSIDHVVELIRLADRLFDEYLRGV